jgi:hypothetical protein
MIKRFLSTLLNPDDQEWLNNGEPNLKHALVNLILEDKGINYEIWFKYGINTTIVVDSKNSKLYTNLNFRESFSKDQRYGISKMPLLNSPYHISFVKPNSTDVMIQIYKIADRKFIPKCDLDHIFAHFSPDDLKSLHGSQNQHEKKKLDAWNRFRDLIQKDWYFYYNNRDLSVLNAQRQIERLTEELIPLNRMDLIHDSYDEIFGIYI